MSNIVIERLKKIYNIDDLKWERIEKQINPQLSQLIELSLILDDDNDHKTELTKFISKNPNFGVLNSLNESIIDGEWSTYDTSKLYKLLYNLNNCKHVLEKEHKIDSVIQSIVRELNNREGQELTEATPIPPTPTQTLSDLQKKDTQFKTLPKDKDVVVTDPKTKKSETDKFVGVVSDKMNPNDVNKKQVVVKKSNGTVDIKNLNDVSLMENILIMRTNQEDRMFKAILTTNNKMYKTRLKPMYKKLAHKMCSKGILNRYEDDGGVYYTVTKTQQPTTNVNKQLTGDYLYKGIDGDYNLCWEADLTDNGQIIDFNVYCNGRPFITDNLTVLDLKDKFIKPLMEVLMDEMEEKYKKLSNE
jgi:hypothetical protein